MYGKILYKPKTMYDSLTQLQISCKDKMLMVYNTDVCIQLKYTKWWRSYLCDIDSSSFVKILTNDPQNV